MFGNKKKNLRVDTLIGQMTEIKGDIVFSGGLHLDGMVAGNIYAEDGSSSVLILSNKGSIEGDVTVPNIVLNGNVTGDVYASEKVELASEARVSGNVYYNLLEMAMGAEINGNMVHRAKEDKALLEHKKDDVVESKEENPDMELASEGS